MTFSWLESPASGTYYPVRAVRRFSSEHLVSCELRAAVLAYTLSCTLARNPTPSLKQYIMVATPAPTPVPLQYVALQLSFLDSRDRLSCSLCMVPREPRETTFASRTPT
jgi:hypothetical protein